MKLEVTVQLISRGRSLTAMQGVKAETCWLRWDSAGRKTCEWNPSHLQRGTTFLSGKINVAKNRVGQRSPRKKRKELGWFGMPGAEPQPLQPQPQSPAAGGEQPRSHPQPSEMWSGKGSGAKGKKKNTGEGWKIALKMTKQFVIKGRERLVKPLSKLGLSLNLGIKSGWLWLRLRGGSSWVEKDKVLNLVPDK